MIKVLLIDDDRGRGALIERALMDATRDAYDVLRPEAGVSLIKLVESFHPDVIIIEVDSPSRDTLEHLAIINELNPKPVVVFSEDDDAQLIARAIRSGVSAYVVDGLEHHRISSILEVAIARFREYQALKDELAHTKNQLADRKVIEKAKGFLMKQKRVDESEAFGLLRKMAMDQGLSLGDVAARVMTVAELMA